jgi:hypothetical protein
MPTAGTGTLSSSWALPLPPGQALPSSLITELNPNDVLLGRGALCDRFPGNIQFRTLIRNRKDEYCSAHTSNKKVIAQEIVESVHSTGGRFLCRCLDPYNGGGSHDEKRRHSGVSHVNFHSTTWKIANEGVAIEKVKQALRDMNSDDSKPSSKKEPSKKVAADPSRRPTAARPRRAAQSSFGSTSSEDVKPAAIVGPTEDQSPPSVAGSRSELREEEIALVRGLLARMANDAPVAPVEHETSGEQPARDQLCDFPSAVAAAQSEPLTELSQVTAQFSGFATSAATLEHSHSMAAFSSASNDSNSQIRSLVENAVWLQLQQDQQHQQHSRFVSSLARSPLDAVTALRVSATWREIPGNYLRMLPTLQQQPHQPQQSNENTAPFTNRDWHILSLTRAWAESHGDTLCLVQIGLFLTQLVREVPSFRVQLTVAEAQELVQALGELQWYTLGGALPLHAWMQLAALR